MITTPEQKLDLKTATTPSVQTSDPELSIPRAKLSINLVNSCDPKTCRYWITLHLRGSLTAQDILLKSDLNSMLHALSEEGLKEDQPIMITDAAHTPPLFIYTNPLPLEDTQPAWQSFSNQICQAICSWAPETVGIYIPHQIVSNQNMLNLILTLLSKMSARGHQYPFYLWVGNHGLNTLINTTLDIRAKLRESQIDLTVLH